MTYSSVASNKHKLNVLLSPPKRRCLGDPDVDVVVGGTLFKHHSLILCYSCDYFDAMLSSGMQESQSKVIEFPNKNPEDWILFYPFLEPRSVSTQNLITINKDNGKVLLPWFHEFGMMNLLHDSDLQLLASLNFVRHLHKNTESSLEERRQNLMSIAEWMQISDMYELPSTRAAMQEEIMIAITFLPDLITRDVLTIIAPFFAKDRDAELWRAVRAKLAAHVAIPPDGENDDALRSNPLFLDFLTQTFKLLAHESKPKQENELVSDNIFADVPHRVHGVEHNFVQQQWHAREQQRQIAVANRRQERRRQAAARQDTDPGVQL